MLRTIAPYPFFEQEPILIARDRAADITDFAWVQRQYPIILFCALLGAPQYTAHTNLIIDARKGQFFQQQSILAYAPIDTS